MNRDIVCIGAGYIGGPTMAVIALKNPGRRVYVVDIDSNRIAAWNSDNLPIFEPELDGIVRQVRGKNLFFTTDIGGCIRECDIVFVGINTPTKMFGKGFGRACDLQYWESAARSIAKYSDGDKIVVEKSTVPVCTASSMSSILRESSPYRFSVVSNPEFLAEGSAIRDLMDPARVLIGGDGTDSGTAAVNEIVSIYAGACGDWVSRDRILTSDLWSVELSKLAANAILAQRVSSINSIAGLCEKTGARVSEVSRMVGADSRIGPYFLKAGPGFGGSCFKKDVLNLVYLFDSFGMYDEARYWEKVISINEHQYDHIVSRLIDSMFNTVAGKRIAVFGFSFKANTGDTRESPAYYVSRLLLEERAYVAITDPKALSGARRDLDCESVSFEDDPYRAAEGADAIVVMTDWDVYKTLDWSRIYKNMRKPAVVYDTRNLLDGVGLSRIGFKVLATGTAF